MTVFASVQTAADSAPLTWGQVLVAIAGMAVLCLAIAAPVIRSEWRKARRVIDEMPLPPTPRSDVPRQGQEISR